MCGRPLLVAGLFTGLVSCLDPTEMVLTITTDADCRDLHGVNISVGPAGTDVDSAPPSAGTTKCIGGRVGTLVLVPSGRLNDKGVGVSVIAGFGAGHAVEQCVPPYGKGCIVARRLVRYVPHRPLTLPIRLSAACDGIPCEPDYTCDAGKCVPATIDDPSACASDAGCNPPALGWEDCGDMSGLQQGSPWPMTDGCATHITRSPYVIAKAPRFRWRLPQPFALSVFSRPVVAADGTLFFGTPDGALVGYDGKTGASKGGQLLDTGGLGGNAAIGANGDLSITSYGDVWCVGPSLMDKPRWSVPMSGTDVAIGPGQITYSTRTEAMSNQLVGITAGGQMQVALPLTAPAVQTTGAPSIGLDGTVYVAAGDGFVYAVNPTPPGALLWKRQVATCVDYNNCTSPVVVTKDRLFFVAPVAPGAFGLLAMDHAANPIAGWSKPANRKCLSIAKDRTVFAADGSRLQAFDPDTAAIKWSVDLGANPTSCTLEGSGALVAIVGAELVAVDTTTHAVRWRVNAYKGNGLVLGNDGSVFMLTDDHDVVALGY